MIYPSYLTNLANAIYLDLGEPDDYAITRIYAWLLDNTNLGKLNNLIGTQFTVLCNLNSLNKVTGMSIDPEPNNDQLAIYKQLFEYEYYNNQARTFARSAGTKGSDWTSLREGDSSITRINANEVAKTLRGLAQDTKAALDQSVKMYLKYNAVPDQVAGDDAVGVDNYTIYEYNRISY